MGNGRIVESRYRKDLEVILSHPKCKIIPYSMLLRVWSSLISNESADTIFTTSLRTLFHCQINTLVSLRHRSYSGIRNKIRVTGKIN